METPYSLGRPRGRTRSGSAPYLTQDPIGPTGLAGVLRVPLSIPSVLDDVPTPASTALVSPSLLNHDTSPKEDSLCDTSVFSVSIS
jgi:hypothetical protein